jgi:cytochrome c biogenesis protein CcmG/thiol:disulfide interchange protein DsbE
MWKSVLRVGGAVFLAAGGLWLATFGSFEQEVRQSVEAGYPLPGFRLALLNDSLFAGDTTFVDSASLRGHVVLLTFWATWCRPCLAEQPSLLALQEEFSDDGLVVLGILHEDRPNAALEWLQENDRLDFASVVGTEAFARAVHVGGLPHTALINQEGVVTELFLGYWPERDAYVRHAVQDLLQVQGAAP